MENSTSSGCATNLLATYSYDTLSRRINLAYGNGASMAYSYSPAGDLLTLNHDMSGTGDDPHFTYTYGNAHQLASETNTDSDYAPLQPTGAGTDSYAAVNTLNQYPSITPQGASGARNLGYDAKGNLTSGNIASNGTWTFVYDAENRMLTASKSGGGVAATYAYDPLGRRSHKSGTGVTETFFVSDGTDEIAEYNGSGTVTLRYVPGPAIDEPIAMVTASSGAKEFFHTNRQGSVIAMSDATGARTEGPFVYDPYGNGAATTGVAFKYTGRRLDPETGLYFYRARYYWPLGGRFMQTDPVGFTADPNLYTYVADDPTDKVDPMGLDGELYWTAHDQVEYTVRYYVDNSRAPAGFTESGLNAAIAHNFSGQVRLRDGTVVTITARGQAMDHPGPGINTITEHRSLRHTPAGRAHTNAIGGNRTEMESKDDANATSHEVGGHTGGAGDQYRGGVAADGSIVPADIPGPPNIMRDLGGPANEKTLKEILGGPTNTNKCAPKVHAANNGC